MTKEPQVSELITMREAAQYCGRSHSQVQWYARSGQLRAWKVGMQWLTTEKELDRYFKSRNSQREWLNHCQKMTKFAKIRAGHRCEHCRRPEGFKIRCHILTVYHLDGDNTNWEPENLSPVCWFCYWYFHHPTFVENLFCNRSGDGRRKMLGSDHSLQDGFAQPLANSEWRMEDRG